MYKLPESVDDFNSKYNRSIGFLTFKNKELPKEISSPILLGKVYRDIDDTIYLEHHIAQRNKTKIIWTPSTVRLNNVVSLDFPMPPMGYYCIPGCFPAFLDRKAVRSVHRGWSDHALSLTMPDVFNKLKRYDYNKGLRPLNNPGDVFFVDAYFNKDLEYDNQETFMVLGKDFLAVKANKLYALYYQNFLIGTCDMQKATYKLKIDSAVAGLEDVFYSQVGNR